MIEQAITKLAALGREAALAEKPMPVSGYTDPRKIKLIRADGEIIDIDKPASIHSEKLATPNELASFVNKFAPDAAIFVGDDQIVAVHDPEERIDRSFTSLETTDVWNTVESFDGDIVWYQQKEFRRLLRITLRDALPSKELINVISSIRFESGDAGASVIGNGNAAISREVRAQVTGQSAIPEEVLLTVPVWKNFPYVHNVACAVEVCTDTKRFALVPFAGEIDRAKRSAVDAVTEFMNENLDSDGRVFKGQP